ncbi:hypothetical protein J6590_074896 [Homalodisca vitripennis]|nr:hypothetical protein J6590_074896 [Homalodisca vitripennis]
MIDMTLHLALTRLDGFAGSGSRECSDRCLSPMVDRSPFAFRITIHYCTITTTADCDTKFSVFADDFTIRPWRIRSYRTHPPVTSSTKFKDNIYGRSRDLSLNFGTISRVYSSSPTAPQKPALMARGIPIGTFSNSDQIPRRPLFPTKKHSSKNSDLRIILKYLTIFALISKTKWAFLSCDADGNSFDNKGHRLIGEGQRVNGLLTVGVHLQHHQYCQLVQHHQSNQQHQQH